MEQKTQMANMEVALRVAEELVEALKLSTPAEQPDLLRQVEKLRAVLEQPHELINRHIEESTLIGVMDSLVTTGAVEKVPLEGTITASELGAAVNVDSSVIQRMMRVAICNGVFIETAPDIYAHNNKSLTYRMDALGGMFLMTMEQTSRTTSCLGRYLKEHQPEDIFDPRKSPYVYARGKEGMTYFEFINEDPEFRDRWNVTMAALEKGMPIAGMFPFASLKEQVEREPERAFFVDIAGGRGQALLKLQEEIPGTFGGKLIFQELPIVLDSLNEEEIPNIEKMAYDIFTPQPVKNAHIYFMRRILHDFYNPPCIEILKNTAQAMGPDSRLIVCDMLVPEMVDVNGPKTLYWLDFNLMLITGKEKTLKEFNELFDAAGLELVKIYPSGIGATVQLEARLKRQQERVTF